MNDTSRDFWRGVIATLGRLTVQRAFSNNVMEIIRQCRIILRTSGEQTEKKINQFWCLFYTLGEFISAYCLHNWFCLCGSVCDVLTSITSILDILNPAAHILSGVRHRRTVQTATDIHPLHTHIHTESTVRTQRTWLFVCLRKFCMRAKLVCGMSLC